MKLVYKNRWLRVFVPTTSTGWCGLVLVVGAMLFVWRGDMPTAWDMLQAGLLFQVLDRLPEGEQTSDSGLKAANDRAEHFERRWSLATEDADRYTFAKTLEGQVVTMETFKVRGGAELDQALDDAMAEYADERKLLNRFT